MALARQTTSCSEAYRSSRVNHTLMRAAIRPAVAVPVARGHGVPTPCTPERVASSSNSTASTHPQDVSTLLNTNRRATLRLLGGAAAAAAVALVAPLPSGAVQGLTAGRIPGLSQLPDADGLYTYTRPEGKSGGHGVGWSEMPRYSFRVPEGWEETPVSIADLGGTEIDLRFARPDVGNLQVVVAPVLRFADVGFNADVRIDQINSPDAIISGFAPELFGRPLDEGDVLEERVTDKEGIKYYEWEVRPHSFVSATAVGNRVFILTVNARSSRAWAKARDALRVVQSSFYVPPPRAAAGTA